MGRRIGNMHMLGSGAPIEPEKEYVVAGWGSVNEDTQGPPIWEVVAAHLKGRQLLVAAAAQIGQDRACRRLIGGLQRDVRRLGTGMLTQIYIHLGVALAGLVSFLSPCVLPLVPPYLGYLSGTTIEQMTEPRRVEDHVWRRVVLASVLFVLGFTTVFVALGAGASVLGQWVQDHKGAALHRRRARHHRLRPAFPRAAARAAALSPGALSRAGGGGEPGRRLHHGAGVRLRLDALHRPGAGDRAGAGGERGEPRRRRPPAARLLARARHPLRPGGGGDRPVRRLPAALPQALGPGRDGDGGCCSSSPAS